MSGISRLSGTHFHFRDVPPTEAPRETHQATPPPELEAEAVREDGDANDEDVALEYFGEREHIVRPKQWPNARIADVANEQSVVTAKQVEGKGHFGLGSGAPPISHDDLTMAQLALIAHNLTRQPLPSGWRELTGDELLLMTGGLATEVPATGFEAHLYVREAEGSSPEYVLAFRGTDHESSFIPAAGLLPMEGNGDLFRQWSAMVSGLEFEPRDAWSNTINGAGRRSPQYEHAQALARSVSANVAALPSSDGETENLRYTGLSLGGGLATAASLATGHHATVINAADVATVYVTDAASRGVTPNVRRITVLGDPLQVANALNPRTTTVGTNQVIGPLLGEHPRRRHYAADIILDAIRAELP